jgi:hypothetical protein
MTVLYEAMAPYWEARIEALLRESKAKDETIRQLKLKLRGNHGIPRPRTIRTRRVSSENA